jgi:hypothetical protein
MDQRLVRRPLIYDDAEVVQLLDDSLDVAAEFGAVGLVCTG